MRRLMVVALLAGFLFSANAQKTSLGVNLQLSFPQGEYKSIYPKTGVGLRFNVFHRLKDDGPLSIGGDIGFLVVSSDSRFFDIYYGGYYDTYKVSASNNVLSLALKARADLMSNERPVQLFVEGTAGANLFYSSVSIERETYFGNSQYVDGDNSKGYWAFTWGPGIGIDIPIDKRRQAAVSRRLLPARRFEPVSSSQFANLVFAHFDVNVGVHAVRFDLRRFPLQVLGRTIAAPDNDQILDPATNKELPIGEVTQVSRLEPSLLIE